MSRLPYQGADGTPGSIPECADQAARGRPASTRTVGGGRVVSPVTLLVIMTSLWPRLEPLLAKVQKPARYIGCEDGARQPQHHPAKAAWLLIYPDTYEIGLPNQGLQILYEILNERADAVAERSYAPWVDLDEQLRLHGVPLFSVDTHRP